MKNIININKNQFHYELDHAIELKNKGETIGEKVTCLTREKIFTTLIDMLRFILKKEHSKVYEKLPRLLRQIKLHIYQLGKLEQHNVEENKIYFRESIKAILSLTLKVDTQGSLRKGNKK